jgi:hypothetical protein
MSTILLLLIAVALILAVLYFFVFFSEVPDVARERFGELETLPGELGKWGTDEMSSEARAARAEGLAREVRVCRDTAGGFGANRLLRQVRYRSIESGEIVRVDPDEVVKRRRVRRH